MSKIEKLKQEIMALPPEEQRQLMDWLSDFLNEQWDAQIARDAAEGKLDFLIEEAKADMKAGRCRPLP